MNAVQSKNSKLRESIVKNPRADQRISIKKIEDEIKKLNRLAEKEKRNEDEKDKSFVSLGFQFNI